MARLPKDLSRQCRFPPEPRVTASARVTLDALGAGARELLRALGEAQGPGRSAWIVGGAVRDALSGSMARDLDLTVPSGAIALARELAGRLGAAFLILDEARGAARMIGASGYAWRGPQVGFADFRAPGLSRVSAERARDELLGIFGEPASAEGLRLLDGWGALAIMLPELNPMKGTAQSDPHCFDVWEHSLRAVEGADFLCLRVRELE